MNGKILIVEDYADWRELLCGMLLREGYDVKTATTLEQARGMIHGDKRLDLAILDIRLVETDESNEDGMQLLAEIHSRKPYTRVIMISGHGTMEKQRKAFRQFRAFDFFRKEQFDSDEFRRGVHEAVEEAARERSRSKDSDYIHDRRFEQWRRETET